MKPIDIVYACDNVYGIGKYENGKYILPWSFNVDMKYFSNLTTTTSNGQPNDNIKNAVIMGKNTWLSIPTKFKPLPNRINIIISTTMDNKDIDNSEDVYLFNSFDKALKFVNDMNNIETVFVIGGSILYNKVFSEYSKYIRYIYETYINCNFDCGIIINNYNGKKLLSEQTFSLKNSDDGNYYNISFNKYINVDYTFQLNELVVQYREEDQYLNILRKLITNGEFRKTRNSNTWSLFDTSVKFNMENGVLPVVTTKKVSIYNVFEELMWFLRGDTNAKHLDEKNVKIWNSNSTREFLDSCGHHEYEEFDIGPMYGFNMVHYGATYTGMNTDYTGEGYNQIDYVLNLIKTDPNSRRIIMTTFNPAEAKKGVLYPCHGIVTQFYVRDGNKLDMSTYQRSVDIFCGFPYNITSYALLCHIICRTVNADPNYNGNKIEPGIMTIHLGDYHLYEQHYDQAIVQLLRTSFEFPRLDFNNTYSDISKYEFTDLKILDYKSHQNIVAKMVA